MICVGGQPLFAAVHESAIGAYLSNAPHGTRVCSAAKSRHTGGSRRQLTTLTQRWVTHSTLEGMLKKLQRRTPTSTARNRPGIT
jgi:hypothetical protein